MLQSTLISARHFYSFFDKSTLIWDATYFSSIIHQLDLMAVFVNHLILFSALMCVEKIVSYQSLTLMKKCTGSKLSKIGTHKLPLQFFKLSQVDKKVLLFIEHSASSVHV